MTPLLPLKNTGLVRDLNPGPLAPKARIIPLDKRASYIMHLEIQMVKHTKIVNVIDLPFKGQ